MGQSGLRSRIENRRFLKESDGARRAGPDRGIRRADSLAKKNTHRRPSRPAVARGTDWTAAGFGADVGLIGWAQRGSRLRDMEKIRMRFPEAAPQGAKKPTSGRKWAW